MGKSRGVVSWASTTGKLLTIFTSRHELYDQYEDWCREEGLTSRVLPAFHRECPTMADELALSQQVEEVYQTGIAGKEIHDNAQGYFGQKLPCQQEGPCPYIEQRDLDPEKYDVLIGHYLQAHRAKYISDRYVAFDEFPGDAYFFEAEHNEATKAVRNLLEAGDTLPFDKWKKLERHGNKDRYADAVNDWKNKFSTDYPRDTRVELQKNPDFHANAPPLTLATLEFELLDNGWEYADLGGGSIAVRSPQDDWTLLTPPSLDSAESVVGLDGTPTLRKWRLALGEAWVHHEEALDSEQEKREYLRDVLELRIIQTDGDTKPYNNTNNINSGSDGALLEGIYQMEGIQPCVITTKKAMGEYSSIGVDEHIEAAEHFANLKGSNEFSTTRLGAVIGSPQLSDGPSVERWAALDNEAVEAKTDSDGVRLKGEETDFGPIGNNLFSDTVQKEVLQAVMRFGRKETNGQKGATVYVHTSRLPEWVQPEERITVDTWSNGMKEVAAALEELEEWPEGEVTNKDIAAHVSITNKQVCELMKELDANYVTSRRGGRGNAYHWSNVCMEEFEEYGLVEPEA